MHMTLLIIWGSGLIGKYLSRKLKEKGYDVAVLSRKKHHDPGNNEMEKEAIEKADYIIHLAGANISDHCCPVKK